MELTWPQVIVILLPVVVGAIISVVPTLLMERLKQRAALMTRWDTTIHEVCAQFAATTRRILDLAEQFEYTTDKLKRAELLTGIRDEHSRLQVYMAEIRLLAGVPTQQAARTTLQHAFTLYLELAGARQPTGEDGGQLTRQAGLDSLFAFYRAVREQLRVPSPDALAPMNLSAPPDPFIHGG